MSRMTNPIPLRVSAPGRICLFGEHQDYLGLPVIAAAIDLRIELAATPRADALFFVEMPDIGERLELDPNMENRYRHGRDYLPAAANVLRREGLSWTTGYDVTVTSGIPINAGASSSSALQVAWCALLLAAAGDPRAGDAESIARVAHQSEVTEFDSPGGMMDHFSSAVGGAIWLDSRPPYAVTDLPAWMGEFVLVESGIPKDTNGVLGEKRRRAESLGAEQLLDNADTSQLSAADRAIREAVVQNRKLTLAARALIETSEDADLLGVLLSRHHDQLSRNLGVSLPEIDRHLARGIGAGALGGKINGSGCGGSFFLMCPGQGARIAALYRGVGLSAHVVRIGKGVAVEADQRMELTS